MFPTLDNAPGLNVVMTSYGKRAPTFGIERLLALELVAALSAAHDRLCAGLGIMGWRRFRLVTLPAIMPDIGFAAGLASALSIGDMTIIALFGSQQFQTLPWLLYQTMARYRAGEAAARSTALRTARGAPKSMSKHACAAWRH